MGARSSRIRIGKWRIYAMTLPLVSGRVWGKYGPRIYFGWFMVYWTKKDRSIK